MPADQYDAILGLIQQGTGNNNNTWGDTFNTSFAALAARAIAGGALRPNTGGTLDLSGSAPPAGPRQDIDAIQVFSGALIAHLTIVVPNRTKTWWFQNNTTGNFNLYVKTPAGPATQIPQNVGMLLACDGLVITRADKQEVGSIRMSAKFFVGAGELLCDGGSYLKADYPDLFAAIGTLWGSADSLHFNVPNMTDTGRFPRCAIPGTINPGNYQSNQNGAHSHTVTGAPGVGSLGTDNPGNHTHANSIIDPGHSHPIQDIGGLGGGFVPYTGGGTRNATGGANDTLPIRSLVTIGNSATSISISNAAAGAHTHTITGAPDVGSLGTAASGGSEARPEAVVFNFCIKY